jgi:glucans biosynthesis protein
VFAKSTFVIGFVICLGVTFCRPATSGAADTNAPPPGRFDRLIAEARASAAKEYQEPVPRLPTFLKDVSYDAYLGIRFRPEKSLWHDRSGRFQVQFFHPGYLYQQPVRIVALENDQEREIKFDPDLFDYGQNRFPEPVPRDLFLTGLRVLYPVNQPTKPDEVAVFLGTSFFRILGAHQHFGSSLRGLAIDTAESSGEEFPRFTDFWIEKPGPNAEQIRIYARLESRRVAGAYQFLIKPGESTVVEVEASLFFRAEVKKLGLAPLTGMFLFGENRTRYLQDFRPEVHDTDGLLVQTAKQTWEWRPLFNPIKVHQTTAFPSGPGFGLLQRDRHGDSYQDLEAHYESRPSYWVAPEGDWGAGHVELVEIPSTEERNDNIVAYWVPDRKIPPGQEFRFRYKLYAFLTSPERPPSALLQAQAIRLQPGKDRTRFIIDFAGGSLATTNRSPLTAKVQSARGKIENVVTQRNPLLDGWRTFFDLIPEGESPIELRVWLQQGEQVCSETWVYHFSTQ